MEVDIDFLDIDLEKDFFVVKVFKVFCVRIILLYIFVIIIVFRCIV